MTYFEMLKFVLLHLFVVSEVLSLNCITFDGPCKCATEEGLIDLRSINSRNGPK